MKRILFGTLIVLSSGAAGIISPATAQENWAGVPAVIQPVPLDVPSPVSLVGNEWVEARCNNTVPGFTCPTGFDERASLVRISEFARAASVFGMAERDRRDAERGIAAAVAMGSAAMPSAPGRTSYVFNLSTFGGEQALGGSIMHRLSNDAPIALSLGFSLAKGRNQAARVGVAGEF